MSQHISDRDLASFPRQSGGNSFKTSVVIWSDDPALFNFFVDISVPPAQSTLKLVKGCNIMCVLALLWLDEVSG